MTPGNGDPQPAVLLISGVDTIGIGRLPRLWFDAGYEVHLLGSNRLVAGKSGILAGRIPCAPGPESAARTAREHLASETSRYRTVVFADEPTLWAATDEGSTEWLAGWFPVPITPASLALLRSKTAFLCACRDAGITTPAFEICTNESDAWRAAESMAFPLYVKANRGWAGSGLFFAESKTSFEAQIEKPSLEYPLLIQQEIPGQSASISVLYDNGVPVCWFAYLMLRTWPNRFSSACSIQLFPHPNAGPLVEAVGRLTGFTGLAGIDFIWDKGRNRLPILEFNPRPTPVYHLGPHAGVDFARALREMATGPTTAQVPNQSTAVIDLFPQMLFYSLERVRPLLFLRALRDAPWSDTALTAAHFRRFLTHYIPSSIKQKLKH